MAHIRETTGFVYILLEAERLIGLNWLCDNSWCVCVCGMRGVCGAYQSMAMKVAA